LAESLQSEKRLQDASWHARMPLDALAVCLAELLNRRKMHIGRGVDIQDGD
jgi:hypothetical protein